MDGVLVDWDKGFQQQWADRSPIHRDQSYAMEECVFDADDVETGAWRGLHHQAIEVFHTEGFFYSLPPMEGALQALAEMTTPAPATVSFGAHGVGDTVCNNGYGFPGFNVYLCTSPVQTSSYSIQEKMVCAPLLLPCASLRTV
jgi:hypothetical protein